MPATVLGTMEFGRHLDMQQSTAAVKEFLARGHDELDGAFMYSGGDTELLMGTMALCSEGEIVVNEVNFVRKCIATDTSQYDLWGKLVCTNFKLSFITEDPLQLQKFHYKNLLLGEHDVPLTCIEQLVVVNETKRKQKILAPNHKLKFNPTELIIYCKDFRIVRFRFDEAGPESAKKVCLALAHYSQPTDLQLLFAFEYVAKTYHNPANKTNGIDPGGGGGQKTPLFETYSDWDREIKRTSASEWRVCSVNEGYMISTCLPEYFVVPSSLADVDLKQYSHSFVGRRMPGYFKDLSDAGLPFHR